MTREPTMSLQLGAKVNDEKQEGRKPEDPGRTKWVKIRTLPSRLYGDQVRDILEAEGIPSLLKGDDIGVFGPGAGYGSSILGITVWVPEDKQDRARELIEAYLDGV